MGLGKVLKQMHPSALYLLSSFPLYETLGSGVAGEADIFPGVTVFKLVIWFGWAPLYT